MKTFRCLICGYIHTGEEAPNHCPVCDAPQDDFELMDGKESDISSFVEHMSISDLDEKGSETLIDESIKSVIVIGSGIAAISAIETLRMLSDSVAITMVTSDERLPYYRLNLTKYLAGDITEAELEIHPLAWYEEQGIKLICGEVVDEIDRSEQKIMTESGEILFYDRLLLAIGAHAFVPPIQGLDINKIAQEHIYSLRTLEDAKDIEAFAIYGKKILIIGGGILGLETASALSKKGAKVTVAEGSSWLMPRQLNEVAASYIAKSLQRLGVQIYYNYRTESIDVCRDGYKVTDGVGRTIEVDGIIIATGVRPNIYLGIKSNLEVHHGIVVDDYLRSSDPNIYAVGDISEHYGMVYGLWTVANYQGKIGAMNLMGLRTPFGGLPRSNSLKVLNLDVFSVGIISQEDASSQAVERMEDNRYSMFMIRDGILIGSILIGYGDYATKVKKAVDNEVHFRRATILTAEHILEEIKNMH